ncbi:MAG: hypothetical protein CW338_01525 [Clostridiales bacterium]|nr:hypothetical protein [Clostridiales bacterium]
MSENYDAKQLNAEELEQVTGGAGSRNGTEKKAQIINCDAVNIRDSYKNGKILGVIPCGAKCVFHNWAYYDQWGKVTYQNITGYIYKDYFKVL